MKKVWRETLLSDLISLFHYHFHLASEMGHDSVQRIIMDYQESFTCHGLSRILRGSIWERVLWFLLLMGSLTFIGFLTHYLVAEYFEFKIRTEVRVLDAEEIALPSITLCSVASTIWIIHHLSFSSSPNSYLKKWQTLASEQIVQVTNHMKTGT